jgi:hypothetical protein
VTVKKEVEDLADILVNKESKVSKDFRVYPEHRV